MTVTRAFYHEFPGVLVIETQVVDSRPGTIRPAMQWWASEEYREARGMRQGATETNMIVVEGVA